MIPMQNPNAKPKPKSTIFATYTQYAIVNESDVPMNQWSIFTSPATSIHLFHLEDMAEKELAFLQRKFPKHAELKHAHVVEVCVSWAKREL